MGVPPNKYPRTPGAGRRRVVVRFERGGGSKGTGSKFAKALIGAILGVLAAIVVIWLLGPLTDGEERDSRGLDGDVSAAGFDFVTDKKNKLIMHLKPPFIVNLSGAGGRYVMKVEIWLEVDRRAVVAELNKNVFKFHRMMDEALVTLRSYSYRDLMPDSGKERLKQELLLRLNRYLRSGKVIRVLFPKIYFSEMLPGPRQIT